MTPIEAALQKLLLGLGRAHEDMLFNYQRILVDIADAIEQNDIKYINNVVDSICNEIDNYKPIK